MHLAVLPGALAVLPGALAVLPGALAVLPGASCRPTGCTCRPTGCRVPAFHPTGSALTPGGLGSFLTFRCLLDSRSKKGQIKTYPYFKHITRKNEVFLKFSR